MIIKNSQQDIIIDLPTKFKQVGLKISGGTDSAIVAYMLAKYVSEERKDITIIPITVNHEGKAYQEQFAKSIIKHLTDVFGNIFSEHHIEHCPEASRYDSTQKRLVQSLYISKKIQCHYVGINQNPPSEVIDHWKFGPADNRDIGNELRPTVSHKSFRPLINIDKKGVAELYNTLGVMETLFPLTRSCEEYTDDFSKHCSTCWFCKERHWGFGRYT